MVVRKVCQVAGFLLLLSGLFLVLSVSSYSPNDLSSNHYVSDGSTMIQPHDVVRAVLAVKSRLADWALQTLGSAVALLTGIAMIGAWYLIWGRLLSTVAVAWRGLLCLVPVSACANLAFTSVHIRGTQFHAGGFGGKWLADNAVDYLSRPGAFVILGTMALGILCVGVKHPILTALRRGLRLIVRGSCVLVRGM